MKKREATKKNNKKRHTKKYNKNKKQRKTRNIIRRHRKTRKLNKKKQKGGNDDDDDIRNLIEKKFKEFQDYKDEFTKKSLIQDGRPKTSLVILTNMFKELELEKNKELDKNNTNKYYKKYYEYLYKPLKDLDGENKKGFSKKVCMAEIEYNTEYKKLNKVENESNDDKKKKFIYLILTTIVNVDDMQKYNEELSKENLNFLITGNDDLFVQEINPRIFSYFFKKNMEKKYDELLGECTDEITDNCKTIFEIDLNKTKSEEEYFGFEEEEEKTDKPLFYLNDNFNMCPP